MKLRATIFMLVAILSGCASMYTQSPLDKATMLDPGMTKQQVQEIMGLPVKSELAGNIQAWHYCKTGYSADEFVVIFFRDGRVVQSQNYYVTLAETAGATGDCGKFTRRVEFRPADSVEEIRIR